MQIEKSHSEEIKKGLFISHISEETEVAGRLKGFLKKTFGEDCEVFVSSDYTSIPGGDIWFKKIVDALRSCRVVLVLLSKESLDAIWINFEAGVGLGAGAQVMPLVMKNLSKGEVGSPLSHLQVRALHDAEDVRGMIKDIQSHTGVGATEVDSNLFAIETETIASGLPTKGVELIPIIEPTVQESFILTFELCNTGNRDVELIEIDADVPRAIIDRNWHPLFDGNVLETTETTDLLHLRYKVYDGPTNPYYGDVQRLLRIAARDMDPRVLRPLSFLIRKDAAREQPEALIRFKITAVGSTTGRRSIPIKDIRGYPGPA